jgi:ferritin-like protein
MSEEEVRDLIEEATRELRERIEVLEARIEKVGELAARPPLDLMRF